MRRSSLALTISLAVITSASVADDDLPNARPPLHARARAVEADNGDVELLIRIPMFTSESRTVTVLTKDPSVPGGEEERVITSFAAKTKEIRWRIDDPERDPPSQLAQPQVTNPAGEHLTKQMILTRLKEFAPVLVARDAGGIDDYYIPLVSDDAIVLVPGPFDSPDSLFSDTLTVRARSSETPRNRNTSDEQK